MDAIKLLQWKLENERAAEQVEDKESINPELRKKDLYTIDYIIPACIASPADKYVDRPGPFADKINGLSKQMDEIILEQGSSILEELAPFIDEGVITMIHWNKSYRMLNCIIEQNIHSANAYINDTKYDLFYKVSIMGKKRPVNNAVKILRDDNMSPDPFTNKLMKPVIKRYENPGDLRPNDYTSISELVEKLTLIATMGYKGNKKTDWEWL